MWPPAESKPRLARTAGVQISQTSRERVRTICAAILVDAPTAAEALSISERRFHALRKREDFPPNATVVLGPRCVRFRLEALQAFALTLASVPSEEPEQLRRGRVRRARKRSGEEAERLRAGEIAARS